LDKMVASLSPVLCNLIMETLLIWEYESSLFIVFAL
jgi:hypothetical protein